MEEQRSKYLNVRNLEKITLEELRIGKKCKWELLLRHPKVVLPPLRLLSISTQEKRMVQ